MQDLTVSCYNVFFFLKKNISKHTFVEHNRCLLDLFESKQCTTKRLLSKNLSEIIVLQVGKDTYATRITFCPLNRCLRVFEKVS